MPPVPIKLLVSRNVVDDNTTDDNHDGDEVQDDNDGDEPSRVVIVLRTLSPTAPQPPANNNFGDVAGVKTPKLCSIKFLPLPDDGDCTKLGG